ncbi:MAG: HAMP domain-containing sensor histidine kinase [Finegoldia magna]|uniref:sensor histidine kinase n=1 Tax=Finegoldia TaxID=150022 RepID=UPI0012B08183|nr:MULTISPECIES: HAMP domain-containing sensor histidine kinase [Finegoldia]MDU3117768.1 HAMP domain-containing sensor histidine kinase [Finegoldia magna]MDU5214659.1 HAMP domain-containing sensor histidine kinase [Finegoldia magna]MDU5587653.1 HAMP domain-containing sensor histidine kinase [Finegoldia magna]MDU5960082.1 HAMP domain-containing sensor histidine kinase [Finegoldia magna]MSB10801.1 sensor histidine kinase [Finegoldia sp. BIOML-A1]
MKNLKIFPKMFLQIFTALAFTVLFIHFMVFLIFPKTYLEDRKQEINKKANEISKTLTNKDIGYVTQSLDFYSNNNDIKAYVKNQNNDNELQIKEIIDFDKKSENNSLIIEERDITINTGEKISLQFVSTADMKKDAKNLSLRFLPFSLLISMFFSAIISLIYAKLINNNIQEIKHITDKMMNRDKNALLEVDSTNEIGQLKLQINDLYTTLLHSIDDLESKNEEIIKLEKLKYDFFRGASHELKTPVASLKIILENMKYNIGKYKNRDLYIDESLKIIDGLSHSISQILTLSSIENLKNDEENVTILPILNDIINKQEVITNQKHITIDNQITDEKIFIGKSALKIILSNVIGNAVKYTDEYGIITIKSDGEWFEVINTCAKASELDTTKVFDVNCDLNKENSNGLGLYIVGNLLNNYKIDAIIETQEENVTFKIKL